MWSKVFTVFGGAVGVAMVVASLWCWQNAAHLVRAWDPDKPDVAAWAVRSAAVAVAALAQVVLLTFVAAAVFEPDAPRRGGGRLPDVLRWSAATVAVLAIASATALALAGR